LNNGFPYSKSVEEKLIKHKLLNKRKKINMMKEYFIEKFKWKIKK